MTWAEDHPLAAALEARAPDADLVAELAGLDLDLVDDAALVEIVAGYERVISMATARQAEALMAFHGRATGERADFVPDQVGARLSVSRRAAERKVEHALALDVLRPVRDALAAGRIDARKADALVRETDHLSTRTALAVLADVVPRAEERTVPQLRADVRRAELAHDDEAPRRRLVAARAERCVRLQPAPDAMAWIRALLPAEDAMTVMAAVDALADASAPDDPRPVDARRADAFTDTFRAVLDGGASPDGTPLPSRHGRRPHLEVIVAASTLAGLDEEPAELVGYGPIPAAVAREVARDAEWRAVALDPATGEVAARSARTYRATDAYRPGAGLAALVVARDVTCTFKGCRTPAMRCDLDHITPFDPASPPGEQTEYDNLHALCRHHHRMKTMGLADPSRSAATGETRWALPTGHIVDRPPTARGGRGPGRAPGPRGGP